MSTFRERLKELREEKNLFHKDVAKALSVTRSAYSGWEQGRREPDIYTLKLIAKFFGVTVGYLVGAED